MLTLLSVALLVLYLASIHINFRVEASFDLEAGEISFAVSLFYITVFKARGLIENRTLTEGDLTLFMRKKQRSLHYKVDKNSVNDIYKFIKRFNFALLTNLDVVRIYLKVEYGNGDCFKTFAYLGMFRVIFYSLISALKSRQAIEVDEQFIPNFNMRSIKGETISIFKLSVADIIYGFLLDKTRKFKARVQNALAKSARRKAIQTAPKTGRTASTAHTAHGSNPTQAAQSAQNSQSAGSASLSGRVRIRRARKKRIRAGAGCVDSQTKC